jgi:hypothetical protein
MRMSCLITTQNPMTDVTNPARLTQSPTFSFIGSSVVIIEKGRATFTLFLPLCDLFLSLRDAALGAGRDLRARVVPLSAIPQPSHQLGGWYSDLHVHARLDQVDAATPVEGGAMSAGKPRSSEALSGRHNLTGRDLRRVREQRRKILAHEVRCPFR